MDTIAFIFMFLLGTIIGSFLNVVIYRFNTGKSVVKGRSICMTCNRNLRWYELIPVFSFLIQKGKCRRCASSISHQYPIVELVTGLVFALIAFHFSPIFLISVYSYEAFVVLFSFIFSLLIVIVVYDMRHKVIPDKLVYIFIIVSFLSIFINYTGIGSFFIVPQFINILSGLLFALPFAFLWFISRGRWMGLGDAKLILGVGWMLGPLATFCALTLSFWIGSVISLILMAFSRNKINMKTEIPFAPFLVLGTLITFLFNLDIFSLSSLFHF
jgi:leader peptidase (prepilin peptidase)/N-methyltransferase